MLLKKFKQKSFTERTLTIFINAKNMSELEKMFVQQSDRNISETVTKY